MWGYCDKWKSLEQKVKDQSISMIYGKWTKQRNGQYWVLNNGKTFTLNYKTEVTKQQEERGAKKEEKKEVKDNCGPSVVAKMQ